MGIFSTKDIDDRLTEVCGLLGQLRSNDQLKARLEQAVLTLDDAAKRGLPILLCGNGGSASDAQHIAGELVGRFLAERRALNVIALTSNSSVLTALSNDYNYDTVFSRQVEAHGRQGGVLWCLSTSGNSRNVVSAMRTAKDLGLKTLAMTGLGGGAMASLSDILIEVPSTSTPRIQEIHLVLYHFICEQLEKLTAQA